MRIDSSQVSFAATHQSTSRTVVIDETRTQPRITPRPLSLSVDTVQLSDSARASAANNDDELSGLSPKDRVAVLILQSLLGIKIKFFHQPNAANAGTQAASSWQSAAAPQTRTRLELHSESEQTSFQAEGTVTTADGRQIRFSAQIDMTRQFQSGSVNTSPVKTTDPLLVNFGGAPAHLTGAKVAFDLNADGTQESINFVSAGSGFLALDTNGDGQINDGRELFGPQSGSGFAELSAYDSDRNGWIDENDPVFSKLRIWTDSGLSTLADKGIGAISISSAETPFTLKDAANNTQGNIRATGIYLSESGAAGTIQEVDLAE